MCFRWCVNWLLVMNFVNVSCFSWCLLCNNLDSVCFVFFFMEEGSIRKLMCKFGNRVLLKVFMYSIGVFGISFCMVGMG